MEREVEILTKLNIFYNDDFNLKKPKVRPKSMYFQVIKYYNTIKLYYVLDLV